MSALSRSLRVVPLRQIQAYPFSTTARAFSGNYARRRETYVGGGGLGGSGSSLNLFGRPRLPANKGIMFVPQQEAWVYRYFMGFALICQVVERMGKYLATLEPGLRILIPILDKVKYVQSLKGIVSQ